MPTNQQFQQVQYVPQPPVVHQQQQHQQQQPAPFQYMLPMGGPPFQRVSATGTPVFPGTAAQYQQQYTGNAPQCPPNMNVPGFGFYQQQP
jgi:hypothetical protein